MKTFSISTTFRGNALTSRILAVLLWHPSPKVFGLAVLVLDVDEVELADSRERVAVSLAERESALSASAGIHASPSP
jgi:hypothetical protein